MPLDDVRTRYRHGHTNEAFAAWTVQALAPYGFASDNALAIIGVCRDELMFPVEQALHDEWGPAFDMSSLAAMVFLGRSGLAAAANHAPGTDGRRRFVIVVMPHIGIDRDGTVGMVDRVGQREPSTACGAIVGFRRILESGRLGGAIEPDDIEMTLLSAALSSAIDEADSSAPIATDLWSLTDLARRVATTEILRLSAGLLESDEADVAIFSAVMIHGPDGDRISIDEASVWLGSNSERLDLM